MKQVQPSAQFPRELTFDGTNVILIDCQTHHRRLKRSDGINMEQYRVDFKSIPWTSPAEGVRQKVYISAHRQLRLVEYSKNMAPHWCEKGHVGYILDGKMEMRFNSVVLSYSAGDGVFLPSGPGNRHMAKIITEKVTAIFVEDI